MSFKHSNVSVVIAGRTNPILTLLQSFQELSRHRRPIPWSITFCFPLIDSMADFKVFAVIWKSLNSCFPNRLSSAKPRTRCSTETYESPYSFLKSLALCIRPSKSRPNMEPGSSPNTWIIEQNFKKLSPEDFFFSFKQYIVRKKMLVQWSEIKCIFHVVTCNILVLVHTSSVQERMQLSLTKESNDFNFDQIYTQ